MFERCFKLFVVIQSCLMSHDHETVATETGWQVAELKGQSGTLRPSIDLDASTNEEGQTVGDTRNTEKLAITFDNMCEHASDQDDFLEIVANLLSTYDCLYVDGSFHSPLYHFELINSWHCYLSIDAENSDCLDATTIFYDDYCIAELDYAVRVESYGAIDDKINNAIECVSESVSTLFWHLDFNDGIMDGLYDHVDIESLATDDQIVDMYIIDTGTLSTHPEFSGINLIRYNNMDDSDLVYDHGTHVAGIAIGHTAGVANGIKNLYSNGVVDTACFDESCFLSAFEWVENHIKNNYISSNGRRRAVINMSFGLFTWIIATDRRYIFDSILREIISYGGVPIAAAGNSGFAGCIDRWPQQSDYCIKVGSYGRDSITGNTFVSWFSNHGSCPDIYAPGDGIYSSIFGNTYGTKSGTSMASPHIAGTVASMLSVNAYLNFWQIRELLNSDDMSFDIDECAGTDTECRGIRFNCNSMKLLVTPIAYNCPIMPFAVSEDETAGCLVRDGYGRCCQCRDGYFQLNAFEECFSCGEVFGNDCMHCSSFIGCQQCAGDSKRKRDDYCGGLYYCQPYFGTEYDGIDECTNKCLGSPCECWEVNNCQVCHHYPGCEQCDNGYFLKDRNHQCESCQEVFGNECLFCADYIGCQQCAAGYNLKFDEDCQLWYCG